MNKHIKNLIPVGHLIVKGKFIGVGGEWKDCYFVGPFRSKKIAEKVFAYRKRFPDE